MKTRRLFPQVPYTLQRARLEGLAPVNPPYKRYELSLIQKALLTCGSAAACPRCGEVFRLIRRSRYGNMCRDAWLVDCERCERRAVIPVHRDPEPAAPAFSHLPLSAPDHRHRLVDSVARGLAVGLMSLGIFAGMATDPNRHPAAPVVSYDTAYVVFADPAEPVMPSVRVAPVVVPASPATIVVPHIVPVHIPKLDLGAGMPVPVTVAQVRPGFGQSSFAGLLRSDPVPESPRGLDEVDEPPELLEAGTLRYPHDLQTWGVEGTVVVEFVLDSTGRVEPESITVVESNHSAFNAPAIDALRKSLYRPARVGGRGVRVAVMLTLHFTMSGRLR